MARTQPARPEMDRICNLVQSRNTDNDWQFHHALAAGALAAPAALPAAVDLRAAWWDIGNQENTGSCVGWGSTDGVARYMFVKAGKLAQNVKRSEEHTSELQSRPHLVCRLLLEKKKKKQIHRETKTTY